MVTCPLYLRKSEKSGGETVTVAQIAFLVIFLQALQVKHVVSENSSDPGWSEKPEESDIQFPASPPLMLLNFSLCIRCFSGVTS